MQDKLYAQALAPWMLLVILVCVGWPVKRLIERKMKDGKLKRLLLKRW